MLPSAELFDLKASLPTAVLEFPVVLLNAASCPTAVPPLPLLLFVRALLPIAVF